MNHLLACGHCPKYDNGCTIYRDISWVNRRGGCPSYPYRDLFRGMEYLDGAIVTGKARPGQQKQKKNDRKYENKKSSRKYGYRKGW